MNRKKLISDKFALWLPLLLSFFCAIVTSVLYTGLSDVQKLSAYLQIFGVALVPAILPVLGCLTKKNVPWGINLLIALQTVLAVDLGSIGGFYDRFFWWDLLLHGAFGFLCCTVGFLLLIWWKGDRLAPAGFLVLLFAITMCAAVLWELFEYFCDLTVGEDSLRVAESLAAGRHPMADTVDDLLITIIGSILFYLTLLLDRLRGWPIFAHLYRQIKGECQPF